MATYTIEAIDTGGNVVATATVTATGTTNLGTPFAVFGSPFDPNSVDYVGDGDYTFRAFTPETGAYTIVTLTAPAIMTAPTLTGGTESASLTLGPAPDDGGDPIIRYDYEVTDSADAAFAAPVEQGMQTPANLGTVINVSPLTPDNYISRQRAVNSIGTGDWSPASAAATVTAEATVTTVATRSGAESITFDPIATSDLWTTERSGAGSITFTLADATVTGQRTTTLEA